MDELAHNTREPSTLPRSMEHLTPREAEIVGLIGRGCTNREIAEDLVISSGTAERHVANVLAKLDVHSRTEVALWAVQHGLITAPGDPANGVSATKRPEIVEARSNPPSARTATLPRSLATFIGRERDIADVRQLLETSRLLTLTGPGGIGKTRLAVQIAGAIQGAGNSDVALVELADVADPHGIAYAIGTRLDVAEQEGRPIEDAVVERLQHRRMLLVLDNCEHVIAACASLTHVLLQRCPTLGILATSRQPLGLVGETIWRVPPLAVPPVSAANHPLMLRQVLESEAGQLFLQRAQCVVPSFELTARNAPAVARLCQRLDGIPLAIELAAAWVHMLSVEQVTEKLDAALQLLVGGSRVAPPRHQTLRAAIDGSYGLLSDTECRVFERLSEFAGGWSLEAAESVCAGDGVESRQVLEVLELLARASLITCDPTPDAAPRYRLLEVLRQYARERLLEHGEVETARRRHAEYYVDFAERTAARIHAADQQHWLSVLEQEHDNFSSAFKCVTEQHDRANALRLAGALAAFWLRRGYVREGRDFLQRAIVDGADAEPAVRLVALCGSGSLAAFDHDFDAARAVQSEALALARSLGDKRRMAESLNSLGYTELSVRNHSAAECLLREGLGLFRSLADSVGIALSLFGLANLAATRDNGADAAKFFTESLAEARVVGDAWRIASCLHGLGHLAWRRGDARLATSLLRESLSATAELHDQRGLAVCLESLALVVGDRNPDAAARLFGAALALRSESGARRRGWLDADNARGVERVRSVLGEVKFEAARAAGQARPTEATVLEALGGLSPSEQYALTPLTPRETEVVRLVARGSTNREIGHALVITEGTAALHVKHALSKLGFRARAQLAAWSSQQAQVSTR